MTLTTPIDPREIATLHGVRNRRLLRELTAGMKAEGWHGRPLLVVERANGYLAWTGSHRVNAALAAGLSNVPCYVLPESKLLKHGVDAEWGHVMDYERLEILRQIGDETATLIMWQEGRD